MHTIKRIWISVLLGGISVHCGSFSSKIPMIKEQTLTVQNEDATLVAHFIPESDTVLTIRYRVENKASQPLYLFNKLYDGFDQDTLLTDRKLVYVFLNDGYALLCKAIAPVPKGMGVAVKVYPCVTKVLPHAHFEETFVVHLPLSLQTPYRRPAGLSKRAIYKPLLFGLGYFVGTPFTEAQERKVITSDGPAIRFDAFTYEYQKWLRVGPLTEPAMIYETK